ncbi:putative phosphoenolpyruvate synthase, partial [Caerostris darwini]
CRPITKIAAETEHEIKHEFDAPLRCENEYFTVANIGEILPGATSTLGIDLVMKYYSVYFRKQTLKKGFPDHLFKCKYFLTGFLPFYNHVMMTVAQMVTRYGIDTPRSKGFMISIFGRLLDDPQLLSYAYGKVKPGGKPSVRSILRHCWDLFFYDLGFEKVKKKINNYSLSFLKLKSAEETFTALINSCSDFDEAAEMHIESSESSSEWNMTLLQILSEAKGSLDTDVYSDFATLLGTSSNVESAAIPQMIQNISCQIVKDLGSERFRCFSVENLAVSTKKEIKKESGSIDKIFSQLHVSLNFTSRLLLRFLLPLCRKAVRVREAGKERLQATWKVMVSEGRLPDQDLIFFMTLDEIYDLLKTRSPCIISRARSRRKLFPIVDEYKFPEIMRGVPKPVSIPVSRGIPKGYARIAATLEEASILQRGEILITHTTDIGWTPYFSIISGVATELGGLISHGAVVSREYGLPCVAGLQGATKKFRTGDFVLLDGKKGILRRLPQPES